MSGPIPDPIRLVGLTLGYDRHPAVHHLDGSVRAGDLLALVGPNGAGKSTLLKGMAGEIRCLDGRIERAGALAYMPQVDEIDRSFPLTVMDLAGMGLWRRAGRGAASPGVARPFRRRWPRSASTASRRGRSAPCRAGSSGARCSPG